MKMAALFLCSLKLKDSTSCQYFSKQNHIFNVNVNEIVGKVLKDFKISSQRNTNH